MANEQNSSAPAPRTATLRPFYPANLKPLQAEVKAHARARRKWFPHHKEIWKRTTAYKGAKTYLRKPGYLKNALVVAGLFLFVGLASYFLWPDPITHAMRTGFQTGDGHAIPRVNPVGIALLFAQGAACIFGFLRVVEKKKRTQAELTKERYEDWLRREEVKQDDIQQALMPVYAEANPYDPTDTSMQIVLGEHYGNDAHKVGPTAQWYVMRMKGLQTGGVIVIGSTGSGKTSSTLRPIMRQMFGWLAAVSFDPDNKGREKMSGFVLDPKGALSPEVKAVLTSSGVDPVRDPMQASASGPASLTAVYHMLHKDQPKGKDGNPIFNPQIVADYRGRADDYLELGYDAARVERAWTFLQKLQDACKAMLGVRAIARTNRVQHGILTFDGLTALPTGKVDPHPDAPQDPLAATYHALGRFMNGHAGNPFSREALGNLKVTMTRVPWGVGGPERPGTLASSDGALYGRLGLNMETLVSWLFIGREESSLTLPRGAGAERDLEPPLIHPQAPGTPYSQANTLEGYAVGRNQVRRLAPMKVRPTSGVNEYRDAWALRELRLWEFQESQVALAKRGESLARIVALTQSGRRNNPDAERDESFATHLAEDLQLLVEPLDDLLGEGAVAWEHGRPTAKPSDEILRAIDRIKSGLDAGLLTAFRNGDFQRLTVPVSELPHPRPVDDATKRRMKGRYASPDPLVQMVETAGSMRKREAKLLRSARAAAAQDLKRAEEEIEALCEDQGQFIQRELDRWGAKLPVSVARVLRGLLDGLVIQRGGLNGLLQDGLASILGMPTVPPPSERSLLADYLFLGDSLGEAALGLAYAAAHPGAGDLQRGLRAAIDATHASWRMLNTSVVADAAKLVADQAGQTDGHAEDLAGLIRVAIAKLLDAWIVCNLSALEVVLEGPLKEELAEIGAAQAPIFQRASKLARRGAFLGAADNPLARNAEARRKSQIATGEGRKDWSPLIWAPAQAQDGARTGPYWRGTMTGLDMTPLHASQWDEAWGFVTWRALAYSLSAGKRVMGGLFDHLADKTAKLGAYHLATLEAFSVSVAPNIAWRTDGPFTYNPLYAPDLLPIIVAGTFNSTIFAATSKGNDSSDPFWENSGFAVTYNLYLLSTMVDGYTTFPKIYNLAANEPVLREYLAVIQSRLTKHELSVQDAEIATKILTWVSAEWLTEASAKSETKDNVIRSLSVVSEGFRDPNFAFCFAPPTKEDISFPSWTWVMREGKVVAGNLPMNRYEKVAKVVLPLANRIFQQAVLMRDGSRKENEVIEKTYRKRIESLELQAEEIAQQIQEESAERLVLGVFFGRLEGQGAGNAVKGLVSERTRVGGQSHPLSRWRTFQMQGGKGGVFSLGDDLTALSPTVAGGRLAMAALVGGAMGHLAPFRGVYHTLPRVVQAWIETGLFLRGLAKLRGSESLQARAAGGDHAAKALLVFFVDALKGSSAQDHAVLGLGEGQALDPGKLPGFLADPMAEVLDRETVVRLTGRLENLTFEHRGLDLSQVREGGSDAGATGETLRPRHRVQAIYREIRGLEERIASMPNTERPVLYLVDEAHEFVQGQADADYVAVARSNNAINIYATQSASNLNAKMDEKAANQFLDSLPNRIILRMPDSKSAEACAEFLGGKRRQKVLEKSISQNFDDLRANEQGGGGLGKATGGSVSMSIKEEERWIVDLNQIINLRAFEAFAFVWNGKENTPPARVYMKPDYLYIVPEIRCYDRKAGARYADLPKEYADGTDLYALTVPRLLELGVVDASR